jgi:hypothetical protein
VESLIHPVGSFLHAGDSGFHPTSGFIVIAEGLDHDVIMQQLAVRMNLVLLIATAQQLCFRMLIVGSIMVGGGVHDAAR